MQSAGSDFYKPIVRVSKCSDEIVVWLRYSEAIGQPRRIEVPDHDLEFRITIIFLARLLEVVLRIIECYALSEKHIHGWTVCIAYFYSIIGKMGEMSADQ